MKKLRLLFTLPSDGNKIIEDGIFLAKLLNLDIQLDALVQAPKQWFSLSRSSREAQPFVKAEMLQVRAWMDGALKIIRHEGIYAEKHFLFKDQLDEMYWGSTQRQHELFLIDPDILNTVEHYQAIEPIFKNNLFFAYFPKKYQFKNLEDVVVSAAYLCDMILPQCLKIINLNSNAKLHLLSLNTPTEHENSTESIEKVKNFISTHALGRTKISIFYGETSLSAVNDYAELIEGDLIIFQHEFSFNQELLIDIGKPFIRLQ